MLLEPLLKHSPAQQAQQALAPLKHNRAQQAQQEQQDLAVLLEPLLKHSQAQQAQQALALLLLKHNRAKQARQALLNILPHVQLRPMVLPTQLHHLDSLLLPVPFPFQCLAGQWTAAYQMHVPWACLASTWTALLCNLPQLRLQLRQLPQLGQVLPQLGRTL